MKIVKHNILNEDVADYLLGSDETAEKIQKSLKSIGASSAGINRSSPKQDDKIFTEGTYFISIDILYLKDNNMISYRDKFKVEWANKSTFVLKSEDKKISITPTHTLNQKNITDAVEFKGFVKVDDEEKRHEVKIKFKKFEKL